MRQENQSHSRPFGQEKKHPSSQFGTGVVDGVGVGVGVDVGVGVSVGVGVGVVVGETGIDVGVGVGRVPVGDDTAPEDITPDVKTATFIVVPDPTIVIV